ncbi:ANTAR domain-containing protein [Geodermatophilus sp. SYSU D00815]
MTAPESAAGRFEQAVRQAPPPQLAAPELLPARLAHAVAASLPVDGAGLTLHVDGGVRAPLGASDPATAHAERLQFTFGAGPCLRASDDGVAIAFDEEDIRRNWAELHASLTTETPYRAVLSVPLLPPLGPLVVLDLYQVDLAAMTALDRRDVEEVAAGLTRKLADALLEPRDAGSAPGWWRSPDAQRRTTVWQAMGMVTVLRELTPADALEVLRAHAFATGRVVDDVAADLVAHRLDVTALDGAPDGR